MSEDFTIEDDCYYVVLDAGENICGSYKGSDLKEKQELVESGKYRFLRTHLPLWTL